MADRAKFLSLAALAAAGAGAWYLARPRPVAKSGGEVDKAEVFGARLTAASDERFFPSLGDLWSGEATLPDDTYDAGVTLLGSLGDAHFGLIDDLGAGISSLWYGGDDVTPAPAPDMSLPRGIRNNNPGNIRLSATIWQGQTIGVDASFVTFETAEYGIRAIFKVLNTYQRDYGLITIRQMITRWAPAVENDTAAYIAAVSAAAGPGPDYPIDLRDEFGKRVVAAIIQHENGMQPYSVAQIDTGLNMARI